MTRADVLIIGMGPASLFAVKTIMEENKSATVLVLEQGMDVNGRKCPADTGECQACEHCSVICGAGGAGMFSDGKLVLDLNFGGNSQDIEGLSPKRKKELCDNIERTLRGYDGASEYKNLEDSDEIENIYTKLFKNNLQIKFYPVLHMGTWNLGSITTNFVTSLKKQYSGRLSILYKNQVQSIIKQKNGYLIRNQQGQEFESTYVITAVGKNGAEWNKKTLMSLGCHFISNRAYYGVRVEVPAGVMEPLLCRTLDPKIFRVYEDGSKMKIHCVCKGGEVRMYRYQGNSMVGGHSPYTKSNRKVIKQEKSNFNVLLSCDKGKVDIQAMLKEFHNINPFKMVVQRYGDFKNGHLTQNMAVSNPRIMQNGNIRKVLDKYGDFAEKFIQFISDLESTCPGIGMDDTLLYAPAIEWMMDRIVLRSAFETESNNIFAIGDGAGISQGIVYAGATGILAADEICRRLETDK